MGGKTGGESEDRSGIGMGEGEEEYPTRRREGEEMREGGEGRGVVKGGSHGGGEGRKKGK